MEFQEHLRQYLKTELTHKTVVLFGLAREGLSTYQFLRQYLPDASVIGIDDKPLEELSAEWQKYSQEDPQFHFIQTRHFNSIDQLKNSANTSVVLFKTPGIPFSHPFLLELASHPELPVRHTSNTELFFALLHALPLETRPTTIGITGTKGKSTTTALIYHLLKTAGKTASLAGNIGVPALSVLEEMKMLSAAELKNWYVVLELSSHQLQDLPYSPHIAVVQNVTAEHLDYYQDFEEYAAAKSSLTRHQTEADYLIFNPEYKIPTQFAELSKAQKLTYSLNLESPEVMGSIKNGEFCVNGVAITPTTSVSLQGEHNLLNAFPTVLIASLLGISAAVVTQTFATFQPLPHRLEFVAEKNQLTFYNDSQGTTPEAAIAALRSFPGKTIVLLAGGSDKGVSFDEFVEEILEHRVVKLVLFPPTGAKIEAALRAAAVAQEADLAVSEQTEESGASFLHPAGSFPEIVHVNSMKEAFSVATMNAQPGSIILLSPACASFGLFKNYQDRGDQFKACVHSF